MAWQLPTAAAAAARGGPVVAVAVVLFVQPGGKSPAARKLTVADDHNY